MMWLMLAGLAQAQGFETLQPTIPASTLATEDGPGALWVNPANPGFDPDPRYGLWTTLDDASGQSSFSAMAGVQTLSLGLHAQQRLVQGAPAMDWSFNYATAIPLPSRLSLGLNMSWNFIADGGNYFAYHGGLSYRPFPWLGFAAVGRNIGNPDPNALTVPETGAGIALRPFSDLMTMGVDVRRSFTPDQPTDRGTASVRVRPREGLYLRASASGSLIDQELAFDGISLGLEVYMNGAGGGYFLGADSAFDQLTHTVHAGSGEPDESFLTLPKTTEVDLRDKAPPYQPTPSLFGASEGSWVDLLTKLHEAKDDAGVKSVLVRMDAASLSLAKAEELREAVMALNEAGKPTMAYLEGNPSMTHLFVASAAQKVAMHPSGTVELRGAFVELMNLRGMLDLAGIEPQFVKRSKYKSSPETYTNTEPSDPAIEQLQALLDDMDDAVRDALTTGREVDADEVDRWIEQGMLTAERAKEAGIVDAVFYPDKLEEQVATLTEGKVHRRQDVLASASSHSPWEAPKKIAVIYITGGITRGQSSRGGFLSAGSTGSKTIMKQLQQARSDSTIKAVVLRVDSPGGGLLASDEIWHEVERVKARKPVAVSMGGVAASGGYYVSAGANRIFAEPTTITGSIGVYSGKFAREGLYDTIGITTTQLTRGRNANIYSSVTPWDTEQLEDLQGLVDEYYEQFKDRVEQGRGLSPERVEELAQGRVWSGKEAHANGLVDELGGLVDAIDWVRNTADLGAPDQVEIVSFGAGTPFALLGGGSPLPLLRTRPDPVMESFARDLRPLGPLLWMVAQDEMIWALEPSVMTVP